MARWLLVLVSCAASLLLSGCRARSSLAIQLMSDLEPGLEIDRVRIVVLRDDAMVDEGSTVLDGSRSLGRPVRLREVPDAPEGAYRVQVALEHDDAVLLRREVRVRVDGPTVVTVLMQRSCLVVSCPGASDSPSDVECLNGRCVPGECTEEHPELCPRPGCASSAECAASAVPCVTSTCTATGACFEEPRDELCDNGETCSTTRGCARAADSIASGVEHTCVVTSGVLGCTGGNALGALGTLDNADRSTLARASIAADVLSVSAGYSSTCALRSNGSLLCFGANERGQLGLGDTMPRTLPTEVVLPRRVVSFSATFSHACAILDGGELHCWGSNAEGELGLGDGMDRLLPTPVSPGTAFVEVSTGQGHTCAIATDGSLYCFGRNTSGELGLGEGAEGQIRAPTRVPMPRFRHVSAGQNHTCGIADDGALYCWGQDFGADGHSGPLALPGDAAHDTPTQIGEGHDWTSIRTDTFHSCGLRASGELWCWGRNAEGQIGLGDQSAVSEPVRVSPSETFSDLAVGRFHTCARRADRAVVCTGKNDRGELGLGDLARRASLSELGPVE